MSQALNHDIRVLRDQTGQLGKNHNITTETGKKPFAVNGLIRLVRDERDASSEKLSAQEIQARLSEVVGV